MSDQPYKVFIIYAREDVRFRDDLKKSLAPLERSGLVNVWSDRDISPGTEWEPQITKNLETADPLILPLISNDYFESEYIHEVEIKKALKRHARGEARIIPVIIKPCLWEDDPALSKLQVLPTDGVPVDSQKHWDSHDNAWRDVGIGLRAVIVQINEGESEQKRQLMRRLLKTSIENLDLSKRTYNSLKAAKINTLAELVRYEWYELIKFRNFGKKAAIEIEELLLDKGLSFGMDLSKYKLDEE